MSYRPAAGNHLVALLDVPAQGGGATHFDGVQHPLMQQRQPPRIAVRGTEEPNDVGDFVGWPRVGWSRRVQEG